MTLLNLRQLCRRKLHGALVQPVCCFPIQPIPAAAKLLLRAGRSGDFFKAKTPENRKRFFLPSFGVELTGNLIGNAVLRLRPFTFARMVRTLAQAQCRETDAVIHDKSCCSTRSHTCTPDRSVLRSDAIYPARKFCATVRAVKSHRKPAPPTGAQYGELNVSFEVSTTDL